MGELAVTVRLRGRVVDHRVLRVDRAVRIGEAFDAAVGFPGADLIILRQRDHLVVRGSPLAEGEELRLELGAVDVTLAHVARVPRAIDRFASFDTRFLLAALLVAALGTWIEAAQRFAARHSSEEGGLSAWITSVRAGAPER